MRIYTDMHTMRAYGRLCVPLHSLARLWSPWPVYERLWSPLCPFICLGNKKDHRLIGGLYDLYHVIKFMFSAILILDIPCNVVIGVGK